MARPCQYCVAMWQEVNIDTDELANECEMTHRDEERVYALAAAMARVFQHRTPTDLQVSYFMEDADAVVDDFDPAPDRWRVRKLPDNDGDEFDMRFRINEVTYVIVSGEGHITPVRLSTYRSWSAA